MRRSSRAREKKNRAPTLTPLKNKILNCSQVGRLSSTRHTIPSAPPSYFSCGLLIFFAALFEHCHCLASLLQHLIIQRFW